MARPHRWSSPKTSKLPWNRPGSEDMRWGPGPHKLIRIPGATTKPGMFGRKSTGGEVEVSGYDRNGVAVRSYARSRPKR